MSSDQTAGRAFLSRSLAENPAVSVCGRVSTEPLRCCARHSLQQTWCQGCMTGEQKREGGRSHVRRCAAPPASCTSMCHQLGSGGRSLRSTHAALSFFRPLSAVPLINLEPLPSQTAQRGRLRLLHNDRRSWKGRKAADAEPSRLSCR